MDGRATPSSRTTSSESANSSVGSRHFTQAIEKLSTRRWRLMESRHRHNAELSRSASRDAVFDLVTTQLVDHSPPPLVRAFRRSEEHTSELQSLMRISYAVFCLKKKNIHDRIQTLVIQ